MHSTITQTKKKKKQRPEKSKMNHQEHDGICKNQGHTYTLPTLLPLNAPKCIKHFTEQATYKLCTYQFINLIPLTLWNLHAQKSEGAT